MVHNEQFVITILHSIQNAHSEQNLGHLFDDIVGRRAFYMLLFCVLRLVHLCAYFTLFWSDIPLGLEAVHTARSSCPFLRSGRWKIWG